MTRCYSLRTTCCLLALVAAIVAGRAQAQAPSWQLAVAATHGPSSASTVYGIAPDATGNVYLTGTFAGTVTFGSTTLTSVGNTDIFVAKWDNAAQAFIWAQQAGGSARDQATSIAVSGTSVYVAGMFNSSTATFGTTVLANASYATGGCAFVAKLTDAGAFTWAQGAGNNSSQNCSALAVSGNNVYVTGQFAGATTSFGNLVLTNSGPASTFDGYIAKLTDAGATASFAWAQQFGGPDYEYPSSLIARGTSLYLAGTCYGASTFGSITLTSLGGDAFVAKLTDAGSSASFAWVQQAGGPGPDYATALDVSGTSIYVGGNFEAQTGVGVTATFGSTTLSTTASGDNFIAKLTDAGNSASFNWAKEAGNPYTYSLPQPGSPSTAPLGRVGAIKSSGTSVYILGSFFNTTQAFGSAAFASVGANDVFLTKLIDTGPDATPAWAQQGGGPGADYGFALAINNGTVYAAGSATPVASFGSQAIRSPVGATVGFLASLTDASALASTPVTAAPLGIAVYPTPTHSTATVQLPAGLATGPVTMTMLDAVGRVVHTRTTAVAAGTAQTTLDVAGLVPGVYALRVATSGGTGTARLVVE